MSDAFRSGFVALVGRPNVGKSTLLNRIIGEKVSIVSPRPQTTRNKVLGLYNEPALQIVFVDTPGLHRPRTRLGTYMEKSAQDATQGIDLLCALVDASDAGEADIKALNHLPKLNIPRFLLLNKVDAVAKEQLLPLIALFAEQGYDHVIPISARTGEGVDELLELIKQTLPEGPAYYPQDMWTDQTERQMVAEIIRERALMNLKEEVPHGIGVEVLSIKPRPDTLMEIHANIYCERESHKGIIIGKRGTMLQKIGSQAREAIELLLGQRVNLQLWIKVREGWRDNLNDLNNLGYTERD